MPRKSGQRSFGSKQGRGPGASGRKPGAPQPQARKSAASAPRRPDGSAKRPQQRPAPKAPGKSAAKPAAKVAAQKPVPPKPAPPKVAPAPRPPRPPKMQVPSEGPSRSGFALLLGRPNVGKSTLLNRLVGEHIAIVSPRPQTTRTRILGIVSRPRTQIALLDAPGVHKAKGLFNRTLVEAAMTAIDEVDVVLYLAEAGWPEGTQPGGDVDVIGPFHRELLREVAKAKKPTFLVLTKIDKIDKPTLLPIMQAWSTAFPFAEIYPLSGLTGENVEGFLEVLRKHLPEGDPLFAVDQITDQPERTLCAEYIREQIFLQTRQEIPYGTAVVIDEFDESERPLDDGGDELAASLLAADPDALDALHSEADDDAEAHDEDDDFAEEASEEPVQSEASATAAGDAEVEPPATTPLGPGLVRIHATIVVERPSHKGIVIGRGGEMLRTIGSAARLRIERLLGCRVWLGLHVRVIPGWTEKRALLSEFGISLK